MTTTAKIAAKGTNNTGFTEEPCQALPRLPRQEGPRRRRVSSPRPAPSAATATSPSSCPSSPSSPPPTP
ncbi:hypothetical protein G5V59_02670 [Nocardioides sp. W3-2-3]|uniref:hypothetical protein n=1 Tax=Nocardioides convexus TaxID=2712224 RepID=UPI0024186C71|nr:hypothetical protein [Nocardioides convexus]NGZ99656.1 hypothetical protein [Nocardioides convexus]